MNSGKALTKSRDPSYSLKSLILATVASGLMCGGLGFGLGRASAPPGPSVSLPQPAAVPPVATDEAAGRPLVKGRLTYQNARGQLEPDAGACVVLLPAQRAADGAKLRADGLHPNDEAAAHEQAAGPLREQGGRLAIADREGNFRVELPAAGAYRLLALSHFQGRSADADGPAKALQVIEENFERPDQLVGKLAFEVTEITHSGTGTMIWDHTFPKP